MYVEDKTITSEKPQDDGFTLVTLYDEVSKKEKEHLISTELLPFIKSEEPIDATELQNRTLVPLVKELLSVMRRFDPRVEDIKPALDRTFLTLKRNMEEADDVFYGTPMEDRRLHTYNNILLNRKED